MELVLGKLHAKFNCELGPTIDIRNLMTGVTKNLLCCTVSFACWCCYLSIPVCILFTVKLGTVMYDF